VRKGWTASFLALLVLLTGMGCATYTRSVRDAQVDLKAGRPESAIEVINEELDVETKEEVPKDLKKDRVLLALERATLLQATADYELAARDMIAVDQRMEWLNLDGEGSIDLAKYLYSGSATPYRAPAYERLLLNTLNMLNFLAMRDFQGAKVEARRFLLLEDFFVDPDRDDVLVPEILAAGNYLGGVAFEGSRDYDQAIRFYARAWKYGYRPAELRDRLVALGRLTGWRGKAIATPENGLEDIFVEAGLKGAILASEYRRRYIDGQLVAVVQTGMAPYKVPERIPIGAALAYSRHHHHRRHHLTSAQVARVHELSAAGALKWVNFPVLVDPGWARSRTVRLSVDDQTRELEHLANISAQVHAAWNRIAGALMAAAILRMITRAVAGGATRAGSRIAAEAKDAPAIGVLGWIAGLAVEGAMAAADTPDTRSWTTLPGMVRIARLRLEPGWHRIRLQVNGRTDERTVQLPEEGITVVNFSRLR
jgi:hypothetical protein